MTHAFPTVLSSIRQSSDGDLKAATLEEIPISGEVVEPVAPAVQNVSMLLMVPVLVLVAGSILYLAKRGPGGAAPKGGGEKGGLYLMVIGFLGLVINLIYLMVA
jgi:hypothetical protein